MFPISVYTGGSILDGQYGVSYSVPSTMSFPAKEEISFDELKVELYRWLALSPARDALKIRVRFNAAKPPNAYFSEIQVLDNEMWRLIVERSICTGNWNMLQIYVDVVPVSSQPSNVPNSTSAGGGADVDADCSNPQADPASNRRDSPVVGCSNRQMTIISSNDGDEGKEDDELLENHKKRRRRKESSEAAHVPTVKEIERGQIWALYSEIDTLPKYYAMVKQIDVEKARVFIKWLEPYGESVFGLEKSEIEYAFPFGCGIYRLANSAGDWYEIAAFSHQMAAKPGADKNVYEIKPAKNETWAVYRNWNCGWSTDDIKECQYDLVRISEVNQAGITVLFLDKVVGYKAVFRLDSRRKLVEIPNEELAKFSHRIPAYQVTHGQVDGTLSGCWELDTAALPESLLC